METPHNMPAPAQPNLRYRGARTVLALLLREMSTTYGRNPGGYVWAVLQPVSMILLLTIMFSFLLRAPSLGTSFLLFYATGFLLLRLFQDISSVVGAAIRFNLAMMAYPRVTFIDALFARAILATLTQIMVSAIIYTGVFIYDDIRTILTFGPILQAYLLTILLAFGVGVLNSYLTFSFPVWKTIWNIFTRPLILISGVFYIYEDLPDAVQTLIWWNPLIHLTSLVRTGFYATYQPDFINLVYVVLLGICPMVLGLVLLYGYGKDAIYK